MSARTRYSPFVVAMLSCSAVFAGQLVHPQAGFEPLPNGNAFVMRRSSCAIVVAPDRITFRSSSPVTISFVGGHASEIAGRGARPERHHYITGSDTRQWRSDVPVYDELILKDLYARIDARLYVREGVLEIDFRIAPGGNPNQIRLRSDARLVIDKDDVRAHSPAGDLLIRRAVAYQFRNGHREDVGVRFSHATESIAGFRVGPYDRSQMLIIDPQLVYSTFLGGSGDDRLLDIAVDRSGYVYTMGFSRSTDFPVRNALQPTKGAGDKADIVISKLTPDGAALVFSTYLGGTGHDQASGFSVDDAGEVVVTGLTDSKDFPIVAAFHSTCLPTDNCYDGFVTKLNASGSALIFSTYLGGNSSDRGQAVAIDRIGNIYVTGTSESPDFPTTPGAYLRSSLGAGAFVTKFSPDGRVLYSTFLGIGISSDIAVDANGRAVVAGASQDPRLTPVNAFQSTMRGPWDANLVALDPAGATAVYATYLGGSDADIARKIAVDAVGAFYVTGTTASNDFPIRGSALPRQSQGTVFITKFNIDASGADSVVYSTTFSGGEFWAAIKIRPDGSAWIAGDTQQDFPTTACAMSRTPTPIYLARLTPTGQLAYATFFGTPNGSSVVANVALDQSGNIYLVGSTQSSAFPTTPGAFATVLKGDYDGFVAKISVDGESFLQPAFTNVPSTADVGALLSIPLLIRNNGASASAVTVRVTAPSDFAVTGCSAPGAACFVGTNFVEITMPQLAAGASATATLQGRANCIGVATRTLTFTAAVCSLLPDANTLGATTNALVIATDPTTVQPSRRYFESSGGADALTITSPTACAWTASTSAGWLQLQTTAGTGNGTLNYTVGANGATAHRATTISVAGKNTLVVQGGTGCTYLPSLQEQTFTFAASSSSFAVSAPTACSWQVDTDADWVRITTGATSSGSAVVSYTVSENTTPFTRTASIFIMGARVALTQTAKIPARRRAVRR